MPESVQLTQTIGTADVAVLGANLGRKTLTVSPPSSGRVTIAFGHPAVLDNGETIFAGTSVRTFTYDDIGLMLTYDVHLIGDAAGRVVSVREVFKVMP